VRFNGLLAIELFTAESFFQASKEAKSENIAQYFADLVGHFQETGFHHVHIFLDRNSTHKAKMQNIFAELTSQMPIKATFHLMAAYSPKLNLVEYAIHLIRQKALHHADCKKTLEQFENNINELCINKKVLSNEQITNILAHIERLVYEP
jgi:DDE superfamily endonuclease